MNIKNKAIQRIDIGLEVGHPVVVSMEYRPRKPKNKTPKGVMGFGASRDSAKKKKKKRKQGDEE